MINWDTLATSCATAEELTEQERERAKAAFYFLKATLGPRIFQIDHGNRHPLWHRYANNAAWTKRWTIWFASALRAFECQPEFRRFLARLKRSEEYRERIAVLEVADILRHGGFETSLEPKVKIASVVKRPDLMVSSAQPPAEWYIEVSDLLMSDKNRASSATFDPIAFTLMRQGSGLRYAGRVNRVLEPSVLQEVLAKLEVAIQEGLAGNRLIHFRFADAVEVGLITHERAGELDRWCLERNIAPNSLRGPDVQWEEPHRLRLKIADKQHQLPTTHSSVIAINSDPMYAGIVGPRRFRTLRMALQEELLRFPHVSYALVALHWTGMCDGDVIEEDGCTTFCRVVADVLATNMILIPNKGCSRPWTADLAKKFLGALQSKMP